MLSRRWSGKKRREEKEATAQTMEKKENRQGDDTLLAG